MDNLAWDWLSLTKEQRQLSLQSLIYGSSKEDYIKLVDAGNLGVYASLGSHFDYAVFGRDSVQVASDLLASHRELSRRIIHALASLQGIKTDLLSEEEPGKIHHEYRALEMNGSNVPEQSVTILKKLQQAWGSASDDYVRYYGSHDATPLYIRLIGDYVDCYGPSLLEESYHALEGSKKIRDSLKSAVDWLTHKIGSSDLGMLEYQRLNINYGLTNQVWKDSSTSYLHSDGSLANHDKGIAAIELQGYTYDALGVAIKLLPSNDAQKDHWHKLAEHIQTETVTKFWMPEQQYFAQGLDIDSEGRPRQIDTLTSNPGLLLDSKILDSLSNAQKNQYIEAIVTMLMGPQFLTPAGIRCRALSHRRIPGFVDYHGSYTVWPKETHAIARGLRAHGKVESANMLESRLLDSVKRAGEFYEFFYADDNDKVYYSHKEALEHFRLQSLDKNIAVAEPCQAWTISATLAILQHINK